MPSTVDHVAWWPWQAPPCKALVPTRLAPLLSPVGSSPSACWMATSRAMASNTLAQVGNEWPRRLLHVESMTSYERQGADIYNAKKAPRYNILTYTWGRFELRGKESAMRIFGIEWSIPAVQPGHFTHHQLETLIQQLAKEEDTGWIWLDVACIDQNDGSDMKKAEIGRQAAIFQKAERVYAWLTTLPPNDLQRRLQKIQDSARTIVSHSQILQNMRAQTRWARNTLAALKSILSDPWFSSLWTLQEAFLRRDARLVSSPQNASPAPHAAASRHLYEFFDDCLAIYRFILTAQTSTSNSSWAYNGVILDKIIDMLDRSGCNALSSNSPTTLYGATKFRRTTNACDRVYGIMQVFGLQLGESVFPRQTFNLETLEFQLARALNMRSPVLAQMFVHSMPQPKDLAWRISQHCATPERTRGGVVKPEVCCSITFPSSGSVIFHGTMCHLFDIVKYWKLASSDSSRQGEHPVQSIHLDSCKLLLSEMPSWYHCLNLGFDNRQHVLGDRLLGIFPNQLHVALLGHYNGINRGRAVVFHAGMVLKCFESEQHPTYSRIGFCVWERPSIGLEALHERLWRDYECVIGRQ
ncbi:hypothetical protein EJ04DRAFT_605689 [Polyplosphaeria fusca]|uniref:Heterokaryon incompatibility domain-containing protein n=1 Tax=Polyplosphaeria fusca TaxID=682080 RepID=A0A9P4QXN0_9PLEO|nr:hypothetical protein EJ04DRAFT_605689 [Polyplosphaeria fusca]